MSAVTAVLSGSRSWPQPELDALFADGFPAFITADQVAKGYIRRVREHFADLDLMLVDQAGDLIAAGWAVPIRWNGSVADLPSGYTDSLVRAVEGHQAEVLGDTLVICGGVVRPDRTGQGIAALVIEELTGLAERHGLHKVVAPVRPTLKARYPLTPIDRYMRWCRNDGSPFDPWLRTHWRLGGTTLASAPNSQLMTGTIVEWEQWTEMKFPESGEYVIPNGLSTLIIDATQDIGRYVEPNVWMRHR